VIFFIQPASLLPFCSSFSESRIALHLGPFLLRYFLTYSTRSSVTEIAIITRAGIFLAAYGDFLIALFFICDLMIALTARFGFLAAFAKLGNLLISLGDCAKLVEASALASTSQSFLFTGATL
jgi:hypothetical protein